MAYMDETQDNESRSAFTTRKIQEDTGNIVNLSDHMPQDIAPASAGEDLEAQIGKYRELAITRIDAVIQRLSKLEGPPVETTADGVSALRSARQMLLHLDADAPDFCSRLDFLAVQLDVLADCLWQIAEAYGAPRPDAAVAEGDAERVWPSEE